VQDKGWPLVPEIGKAASGVEHAGNSEAHFDGLGKVIEKLPHFADAHLAWMALAVESDEAFTPIGHGRRRRLGVTRMVCSVASLVKQDASMEKQKESGTAG